jgi:UDP-glucose 4-epimerase
LIGSNESSCLPARWLITGGAGFIGCNLIKRLIAEGVPYIRVLDNLSVGTRNDLLRVGDFLEVELEDAGVPSKPSLPTSNSTVLEFSLGDIRNPRSCVQAADRVDIIVHLAANTGVMPSIEDPVGDMQTNVAGTLNMLEAARQKGVPRFIFASSGAPLGECVPPIHEELAPHPASPYGASKLSGEGYCSAYHCTFGLEATTLRFGNVYGPLSTHKSSVVAKFIRQALCGEVCQIFGDGTQTRDFIFVDDLIEAIIRSSQAAAGGEIFQIASGREHTVNEVVELLSAHLNAAGIGLRHDHLPARTGEVKRNFSDTAKAKKWLGWSGQTTLTDGLKRTVDWFLSGECTRCRHSLESV